MKKILVTGGAGFVGAHTVLRLLENNFKVTSVDNLNSYYDVNLKIDRLNYILEKSKKFKKNYVFFRGSIDNDIFIKKIFRANFDYVINLAAQAGVRYSIENPKNYMNSNVIGFFNILDACKNNKIKHLIFASTSSVYGLAKKFPISEKDDSSSPIQFYAATKKANEVMAHAYSSIYKTPITGLRFFTVYGPWDRPDMALQKFSDSMINNKFIKLFNSGNHYRSYTYIDDVVDAIIKLVNHDFSKKDHKYKDLPYKIFNLGNSKTVSIKRVIKILSKNFNKKEKIRNLKLQKGDSLKTHASTNLLFKNLNFKPKVDIENGLSNFCKWYTDYYK
jgi:UDP-glucuronate 4-epimerase